MYKRLSHEIISIFDNINISEDNMSLIDYAGCKTLKICRNWFAHQCISDTNSKDIVFIFLLAMSSLFDIKYMDDSNIYRKSEEDLITIWGAIGEFEFSENIEKLKRAKERYISKLREIVDSSNVNTKKSRLKRPRDNEPIMGVISGIGSEYSSDKKNVSLPDLEKCFVIYLYENSYYTDVKYKFEEESKIMRKIQNWCFSLFDD